MVILQITITRLVMQNSKAKGLLLLVESKYCPIIIENIITQNFTIRLTIIRVIRCSEKSLFIFSQVFGILKMLYCGYTYS